MRPNRLMRPIQVSTQVFAGIWKNQQPGEDTEDAILRRLLGIASEKPLGTHLQTPVGFADNQDGVVFPPGFEIVRIYKGREFRAQAVGGAWIRADNKRGYLSLNQLSNSIGAKENAWDGWLFVDETGARNPIACLRDPKKVAQRARSGHRATAEELGL